MLCIAISRCPYQSLNTAALRVAILFGRQTHRRASSRSSPGCLWRVRPLMSRQSVICLLFPFQRRRFQVLQIFLSEGKVPDVWGGRLDVPANWETNESGSSRGPTEDVPVCQLSTKVASTQQSAGVYTGARRGLWLLLPRRRAPRCDRPRRIIIESHCRQWCVHQRRLSRKVKDSGEEYGG